MTRKLRYSMGVSLDGYIAGPDGNFDWNAPDEELHQFHNDRVRESGGHLLGRRLGKGSGRGVHGESIIQIVCSGNTVPQLRAKVAPQAAPSRRS